MTGDDHFDSIRPFGFRAPRVSTNFSFSMEAVATGKRYEADCTDISEDGLAAELLEPLAPKTEVVMRLLLPGGTMPLQIQGSVEYCQNRRCGLNFLYSSVEERKHIQRFIRSIS